MKKILILTVFLWGITNVLSFSESATTNNNNGPFANMMENLAERSASVAKELLSQFVTKTETTSKSLANNMLTIVTTALQQLAQPFEDLQQKLTLECEPKVEWKQLKQQIDSDVSKCTVNIQKIFLTFKEESEAFKMVIAQNIRQMIDLPKKCQNPNNEEEQEFGSLISCFFGKIADLNQQVANVLKNGRETIIQTRQLCIKAVQQGRACSKEVITRIESSFKKLLSTCIQAIEE